jgi:hypothetical protein
MANRPKEREPPPCPRCRSTSTIQTFEHLGERVFFCAECEHSWGVYPGVVPPDDEIPRLSPASGSAEVDPPAPWFMLTLNRRRRTIH